jgi:hypothetical protein
VAEEAFNTTEDAKKPAAEAMKSGGRPSKGKTCKKGKKVNREKKGKKG